MNLSCLVAADVRRLTLSWRVRRERDQSLVTSAATLDLSSRPQFACTSRCQLPMNLSCLVAADVRRLTLSDRVRRERDQSLVTSAATLDWWVPMRGHQQVQTTQTSPADQTALPATEKRCERRGNSSHRPIQAAPTQTRCDRVKKRLQRTDRNWIDANAAAIDPNATATHSAQLRSAQNSSSRPKMRSWLILQKPNNADPYGRFSTR